MSTTAKQITDILPSYISLYRTAAASATAPPPTSTRTALLKWFTTLSPSQRLAHLTIVDPTFTELLLRMLSVLRRGHSTFFVLADIPSSDSPELPSLCSRKSRGLLGRVADSSESARLVRSSIRLFASDDDRDRLDTVSFCEGFVDDVDNFVEVMDSVSDSGFLNGLGLDWVELGSEWVELGWLKAKGYYSMEAFVANRVEVALRIAWLNSGSGGSNGKKRGVKLKEKVSNAVGVGVNVYWRKRGCVEWWERLDYGVKKKVFLMVLRKTAKSLTGEILKGVDEVVDSPLLHFGEEVEQPVRYNCYGSSSAARLQRASELGLSMTPDYNSKLPISLVHGMNKLLVLQIIVAMTLAFDHGEFDKDKLFFSSLSSVNTIFDRILMKLRGLLMAVSLEYTKLELLELDNQKSMPNKPKEKAASNSKKKGKNRNAKKLNLPEKNCEDVFVPDKALKDSQSGLGSNKNSHSDTLKRMDGTLEEVNGPSLLTSEEKEEMLHTSAADRLQTSTAKNRRQKKKKKARGKCEASSEVLNISIASSSCTPKQCEMEQCEKDNSADVASNVPQVVCASQTCEEDLACFCSEAGSRKEASHNTEPDSERCPIGASGGGELHSIHKNEVCSRDPVISPTVPRSAFHKKIVDAKKGTVPIQERDNWRRYSGLAVNSSGYPSYEWPTVTPLRVASFNSQHLPPATDRLHLEVGHNWQNHVQHSYIQQIHQANTSIEGGTGRVIPRPLLMSFDWPPMVRACNYDLGQQAAAQQVFSAPSPHYNGMNNEDDKKYSADCFDFSEPSCTQEIGDEYDSHWVSEEEYEIHTVSGIDYNQFFGGGVMYWDPSDYRGAGFSRPPSLSSDDSSWAWREADMNRTVDDMVAFSSYSTNGLTSPSAAPFCSPFEPLPPGHQAIGYVRPGKEVTGKVLHTSTMSDLEAEEKVPGSVTSAPSDSDSKSGDSLPYPILRPIIIPNISRERSRSEFKGNRELRSPRVPPNRREQPRIKRPPSPVVLCVPRAPRPPTPSPVGDSRKHRGFPTVRSGSSSPRHWGSVRGWFNDGSNFEEACVRVDGAEVVWPSWGSKKISARQMIQPIPAAILQDRLIAISQLAHDQEHPDIALPLQPPELLNCPIRNASFSLIHSLLHDEIDSFCKQVAAENLIRRPYINWAVKRVTRSLQVLWPRSRTNIFGSNATGVSLPTSDVDLVVCLPPVRNLEPIKEAGILEGRNSIKETCLQHAARYLGNQEWVKADSIKTVENTAIPIIMLEVDVPHDLVIASASGLHTSPTEQNQLNNGLGVDQNGSIGSDNSSSGNCSEINCGKDAISVRLDISFKSPSHTGLQTTELVKQLTGQFTAAIPLALVLKQFLADRSLDQSYSGGLSSYCLVLLITRFLQHEHHHGRSINQNLGSLFMDFLYFFGNVFDPRQMRISIQGSGLYINRERGYSIDPIYIDDPLFSSSTNNVGKNCFRIHQCIKAFADAYSTLETELSFLATDEGGNRNSEYRLLPKIISSISLP